VTKTRVSIPSDLVADVMFADSTCCVCRERGKALQVHHVDEDPSNNTFANPDGLVKYLTANAGAVRLRPDQRLIFAREWGMPALRLKGVQDVLAELARIAAGN